MPERDCCILSATPAGLMAAIAAAEQGLTVVVLERSGSIGGLAANGLGATDIGTRGATAGLFHRFTQRILAHYRATYGDDSQQVRDCSDGHHFEPSVAAQIFAAMLAEQPNITVLVRQQFDHDVSGAVEMDGNRPVAVTVTDRDSGERTRWTANVFIDATYEGDLAAACGAPFRIGREGRSELGEPMAGPMFQPWRGQYTVVDEHGDHRVQAYNYRLCLTDDPAIRVPISCPPNYTPSEYESLLDDVAQGRWAGTTGNERHIDGIGRLTNMVVLPNRKTDANNQHLAFISTDLPEENQDWPTASWAWRDAFAARLRNYMLGLLWFAQNDPRLPETFRTACAQWGFARDEYTDNDYFPRQVYVREGRRIMGDHLFTAHDALPVAPGSRPPLHGSSITASHYALDSHACRKREVDKPHLEGFFSVPCAPYTVPFGVMCPKRIENLLVPVAASATHIGFSTLRMEPAWMALGEAAGVAAALAVRTGMAPRSVDICRIQTELLARGAVLVYVRDVGPDHPHFMAVQQAALRGALPQWEARLAESIDAETRQHWAVIAGRPVHQAIGLSRGEVLLSLFADAAQDC